MINEKAEIHLLKNIDIKWKSINSINKEINNTLIKNYQTEITKFNSNYVPFIKEEILYEDKIYVVEKIQRDLNIDADVFYILTTSEIIYINFEDYIDYFVTNEELEISELLNLAEESYPSSYENWLEQINNLKKNYKKWKNS